METNVRHSRIGEFIFERYTDEKGVEVLKISSIKQSNKNPQTYKGKEIEMVKVILTKPTKNAVLSTDDADSQMFALSQRCADDCFDRCYLCSTLTAKMFIAKNRQNLPEYTEYHYFQDGGITARLSHDGKNPKIILDAGSLCGVMEYTVRTWEEAENFLKGINI